MIQEQEERLELYDPKKHKVVIPDSYPVDRALDRRREVEKWGRDVGVELEISNLCHLWKFALTGSKKFAEWWPSSGRLVVNGKYKKALYAETATEVVEELTRQWVSALDNRETA